jgi:hypothetical protein
MTEALMDFLPEDRQFFEPEDSLGKALMRAARVRWPHNTAKHILRSWPVDPTTAENVTKGHASERTVTKAVKADGWDLWMALGELLIGHTYEAHLEGVIHERERARRRAETRRDNLRSLEARAAGLVALCDRPGHE